MTLGSIPLTIPQTSSPADLSIRSTPEESDKNQFQKLLSKDKGFDFDMVTTIMRNRNIEGSPLDTQNTQFSKLFIITAEGAKIDDDIARDLIDKNIQALQPDDIDQSYKIIVFESIKHLKSAEEIYPLISNNPWFAPADITSINKQLKDLVAENVETLLKSKNDIEKLSAYYILSHLTKTTDKFTLSLKDNVIEVHLDNKHFSFTLTDNFITGFLKCKKPKPFADFIIPHLTDDSPPKENKLQILIITMYKIKDFLDKNPRCSLFFQGIANNKNLLNTALKAKNSHILLLLLQYDIYPDLNETIPELDNNTPLTYAANSINNANKTQSLCIINALLTKGANPFTNSPKEKYETPKNAFTILETYNTPDCIAITQKMREHKPIEACVYFTENYIYYTQLLQKAYRAVMLEDIKEIKERAQQRLMDSRINTIITYDNIDLIVKTISENNQIHKQYVSGLSSSTSNISTVMKKDFAIIPSLFTEGNLASVIECPRVRMEFCQKLHCELIPLCAHLQYTTTAQSIYTMTIIELNNNDIPELEKYNRIFNSHKRLVDNNQPLPIFISLEKAQQHFKILVNACLDEMHNQYIPSTESLDINIDELKQSAREVFNGIETKDSVINKEVINKILSSARKCAEYLDRKKVYHTLNDCITNLTANITEQKQLIKFYLYFATRVYNSEFTNDKQMVVRQEPCYNQIDVGNMITTFTENYIANKDNFFSIPKIVEFIKENAMLFTQLVSTGVYLNSYLIDDNESKTIEIFMNIARELCNINIRRPEIQKIIHQDETIKNALFDDGITDTVTWDYKDNMNYFFIDSTETIMITTNDNFLKKILIPKDYSLDDTNGIQAFKNGESINNINPQIAKIMPSFKIAFSLRVFENILPHIFKVLTPNTNIQDILIEATKVTEFSYPALEITNKDLFLLLQNNVQLTNPKLNQDHFQQLMQSCHRNTSISCNTKEMNAFFLLCLSSVYLKLSSQGFFGTEDQSNSPFRYYSAALINKAHEIDDKLLIRININHLKQGYLSQGCSYSLATSIILQLLQFAKENEEYKDMLHITIPRAWLAIISNS